MTKTTRYIVVSSTARISTRVFVYGMYGKGAKWVNRVAKADRLVNKSPQYFLRIVKWYQFLHDR